jgi:hypothetical protein
VGDVQLSESLPPVRRAFQVKSNAGKCAQGRCAIVGSGQDGIFQVVNGGALYLQSVIIQGGVQVHFHTLNKSSFLEFQLYKCTPFVERISGGERRGAVSAEYRHLVRHTGGVLTPYFLMRAFLSMVDSSLCEKVPLIEPTEGALPPADHYPQKPTGGDLASSLASS